MPPTSRRKKKSATEQVVAADYIGNSTDESSDLPSPDIKGAVDLERKLILHINLQRWPNLAQLRRAYKIFGHTEKKILAASLGLLIFSGMWLSWLGLRSHVVSSPARGGSYAEAIVGQPKYLNPIYASASVVDSDLSSLIFSGLIRRDKNLNLVGDLADSFSIAEDNKVFTVRLKPDLVWHDSEPLTIDDVIFTFESLKSKEVQSPLAPIFQGVVIEKVDDQTVRFTLPNPYAPFLNTLTVGLIPKHIWSSVSPSKWRQSDYNLQPVGSGAWQMASINRDQTGEIRSIRLSAAAAQASRPNPWLDRLIFKFYPDEKTALEAFRAEQVEGLALVNPAPETVKQAGRHAISYPFSLQNVTGIFFNLNQNSVLQDVNIRQALGKAIDKTALIQNILGGRANAVLGPFGTTTYTTRSSVTESPEEILEKAGWKRVGAIRRNKNDDILSVTLSILDRQPDRQVGEFVAAAWRQAGVDVKLDLVSPATPDTVSRRLLRPRSYQALLYTVVYGATLDPYPFWHSSERIDPGLNLAMFSNSEVDKAIMKYREVSSSAESREALQTIENIINKEVPAAWLYAPVRTYLLSDSFKGVDPGKLAQPADRFNDLSSWYLKETISWRW